MKLRRRRTEADGNSQATAMVDVIFILLAFFFTVSQLKHSQLNLELPAVKDPERADKSTAAGSPRLIVEIDHAGSVCVNGRAVEEIALLAETVRAETGSRKNHVMLSADRRAASGVLIQVINQLSLAGLTDVEFEVKERPEDDTT